MAGTAGFGGLIAASKDAWGLEAIANPLGAYPDRGLGARLSRPVEIRLHVYVYLRPQRHAQLPAQSLRAAGSGDANRTHHALRRSGRPERESHQQPLGSAGVPEGSGADPPLLRRPPRERLHGAGRVPAMGERRVSPRRRRASTGEVLPARPRPMDTHVARRSGSYRRRGP